MRLMPLPRTFVLFVPLTVMLIALPLAGVAIAGRPILPYLGFPPLTQSVEHASFSWWVFCAFVVLVLCCVTPFVYRVSRSQEKIQTGPGHPSTLPWWGWFGLGILALAWVLAWNRFAWFERFQGFTFTPLWLGYILVINALTFRRTGHCMLRDRSGYLLLLFLLSALFWWFFEYLNRFTQNWYYAGTGELSPWVYFVQATLPFSTVLPAVLSTREYLASFPRLTAGLARAWQIRFAEPKRIAWITLVVSAFGLSGIGIWPEYLYPLVWVAPLLLLVALQTLSGEQTIFDPLAVGDWRRLWEAALAALLCGFLWELWNYKSLAHWAYSIPYVDRFHVFQMSLLGYSGYLPFGLQCLAVGQAFDPSRHARNG